MQSRILIHPEFTVLTDKINSVLKSLNITLPHADVLLFEKDEKLGVEAARKIREHLLFKPYQANRRIVIIYSLHKMTIEAQNALLKTLEEPPEGTVLLMGASNTGTLLPTVLSRCQIEYLGDGYRLPQLSHEEISKIDKLLNMNLDQKFNIIEKTENKDELLKTLIKYLELNKDLLDLSMAKLIVDVEKYISANGNTRAILEYIILNTAKEID